MKYDISFKEEGKGKDSCNNTESYNLPRRLDRLYVYRYSKQWLEFPDLIKKHLGGER